MSENSVENDVPDAEDGFAFAMEADPDYFAEKDAPEFKWRGLAETLIKRTRWDEWKANGLRWQHEQITLLATELRRFLTDSEIARHLMAQAWDEGYDRARRDRGAMLPVRVNPYRTRPLPPDEGDTR